MPEADAKLYATSPAQRFARKSYCAENETPKPPLRTVGIQAQARVIPDCLLIDGFVMGAGLDADESCHRTLVFQTSGVDFSAAW